MGKTKRQSFIGPVKALKRAARKEFGFEPTRISSNKTKYSRSREKRQWMQDIDKLT